MKREANSNNTILLYGNLISIHVVRWVETYLRIPSIRIIMLHKGMINNKLLQVISNLRSKKNSSKISLYIHHRNKSLIGKLSYRIFIITTLIKETLFRKPSLIHIFMLHNLDLILLPIIRVKKILSIFGSDVMNNKNWLIKTLIRINLSQAHTIIVSSKPFADEVSNIYGIPKSKFVAVHWGSPAGKFRPMSKEEAINKAWEYQLFDQDTIKKLRNSKLIIFSPRFTKEIYNTHIIIEAFYLIYKKYYSKKPILIIISANNDIYSETIKSIIQKLKLENNIIIINRILNENEMNVLFNLSDIVVSIPKHDQFASSIVEAMLTKKPIIVNRNIKAYREHLENFKNAVFIEPKTDDLAKAISYLINNPEQMELISKKAYEYAVKNLTYEENIKKISGFLSILLRKTKKEK